MASINPIRTSPIAGTWYSANSKSLTAQIDKFVENAEIPSLNGKVLGVLAPHAGYQYSGSTAGFAFRTVQNLVFDLVVILSPYHAFHSAPILSSAHQKYSTPLGEIPVDHEILQNFKQLLATEHFQFAQIANDKEHSLEIEIPFLQRTLSGNFCILPLMIRQINPNEATMIAKILFQLVETKKVLVVVSSDLSHFYSDTIARKLDYEILRSIESYSVEEVYRTENLGKGFACGLGAILIGMELTRLLGGDTIQILSYANSGAITGDLGSVVGYGSAVFLQSNNNAEQKNI